MPHISQLLQSLIQETHSLRGAKLSKKASTSADPAQKWQVVEENQFHFKGQVETELLPSDALDEVVRKLAEYDDLRWAFFRELRYVGLVRFQRHVPTLSSTQHVSADTFRIRRNRLHPITCHIQYSRSPATTA